MEVVGVAMEAMIEATTMTIMVMVKAVIADITLRAMDTTKAVAPAIEAGVEVVVAAAITTLASETTTETTIIGSVMTDKEVVTMVATRVIIITAITVAAITLEAAQPRQTSQTTTRTLTANRWASSLKGAG